MTLTCQEQEFLNHEVWICCWRKHPNRSLHIDLSQSGSVGRQLCLRSRHPEECRSQRPEAWPNRASHWNRRRLWKLSVRNQKRRSLLKPDLFLSPSTGYEGTSIYLDAKWLAVTRTYNGRSGSVSDQPCPNRDYSNPEKDPRPENFPEQTAPKDPIAHESWFEPWNVEPETEFGSSPSFLRAGDV